MMTLVLKHAAENCSFIGNMDTLKPETIVEKSANPRRQARDCLSVPSLSEKTEVAVKADQKGSVQPEETTPAFSALESWTRVERPVSPEIVEARRRVSFYNAPLRAPQGIFSAPPKSEVQFPAVWSFLSGIDHDFAKDFSFSSHWTARTRDRPLALVDYGIPLSVQKAFCAMNTPSGYVFFDVAKVNHFVYAWSGTPLKFDGSRDPLVDIIRSFILTAADIAIPVGFTAILLLKWFPPPTGIPLPVYLSMMNILQSCLEDLAAERSPSQRRKLHIDWTLFPMVPVDQRCDIDMLIESFYESISINIDDEIPMERAPADLQVQGGEVSFYVTDKQCVPNYDYSAPLCPNIVLPEPSFVDGALFIAIASLPIAGAWIFLRPLVKNLKRNILYTLDTIYITIIALFAIVVLLLMGKFRLSIGMFVELCSQGLRPFFRRLGRVSADLQHQYPLPAPVPNTVLSPSNPQDPDPVWTLVPQGGVFSTVKRKSVTSVPDLDEALKDWVESPPVESHSPQPIVAGPDFTPQAKLWHHIQGAIIVLSIYYGVVCLVSALVAYVWVIIEEILKKGRAKRRLPSAEPQYPRIPADMNVQGEEIPALLLTDLSSTMNFPEGEVLIDVSLSLVKLARDPTAVTLMLEIATLANRHLPSVSAPFIEYCSEHLKKILSIQADSEIDFLNAPMGSNSLSRSAYDILSAISIVTVGVKLGLVSETGLIIRTKKILSEVSGGKEDSLLTRMFSFLSLLGSKLRECIATRSLEPLFEKRKSVTEWLQVVRTLLTDERIKQNAPTDRFLRALEKKEIPPIFARQLSENERALFATLLRSEGNEYRTRESLTSAAVGTIGDIMSAIRQLDEFIAAEINRQTNGAHRAPPLGIYLYGPSDVGKTTIINDQSAIIASLHNSISGSDITYFVDPRKNFWDALRWSHLHFVLDDMDQIASSPAYSDNTFVMVIMDLVNPKPFVAEQAAIEEKGKMFTNPTCVTMATNNAPTKSTVDGFIKHPVAFFRRFVYAIEMTVQPPYRTPAGGLNHDISIRDDTWRFVVKKWASPIDFDSNANPTYFIAEKTFTSKMKFLLWFKDVYTQHLAKARKFASHLNTPVELCATCTLPLSTHIESCVHTYEMETQADEDHAGLVPYIEIEDHLELPFSEKVKLRQKQIEDYVQNNGSTLALYLCAALVTLHFMWMMWSGWFLVACFEVLFTSFCGKLASDDKFAAKFLVLFMTQSPITFGAGYLLGKLTSPVARETAANMLAFNTVYSRIKSFVPRFSQLLALLTAALFAKGASLAYGSYVKKKETEKWRSNVAQGIVSSEDNRPLEVRPAGSAPIFHRIPVISTSLPTVHSSTISMDAFAEICKSAYARIWRTKENGSQYRLWMAHYQGFCWLVDRHFFFEDSTFSRVSPMNKGQVFECCVEYKNVVYNVRLVVGDTIQDVFGRDVVVVAIYNLYPAGLGISTYVPHGVPRENATFDKMALLMPIDCEEGIAVQIKPSQGVATYVQPPATETHGSKYLLQYIIQTENGDCGALGAVVYGTSILIHSIHYANSSLANRSYGELLMRSELDPAMEKLENVRKHLMKPTDTFVPQSGQLVKDPKKFGAFSDVKLAAVPLKSAVGSVLADKKLSVMPLGTIPGYHNSTFNTSLKEVEYREPLDALARSYGVDPDYVIPRAVQHMGDVVIDGVAQQRWIDSYTVNLRKMKDVSGPDEALDWARKDYVAGLLPFKDELKHVIPLSDHEALRGSPEDNLNSFDLNTSTGAPYNTQKKNFFKWVYNGELYEAEVSDLIMVEKSEVAKVLEETPHLVMFVFTNTQKDEALSLAKVEGSALRIFFVGPVVFNWLLKKYLGPIMSFLQRHWLDAEIAIGLNIASSQLDLLISHMFEYAESPDPVHTNCVFMGDLSGQDVTSSNQYMRNNGCIFMEFAGWTAYTTLQLEVTRKLLAAGIYKLLVVKGDVVVTSSTNPSGWLLTALLNSIGNGQMQRATWFLAHRDLKDISPPPPFREYVRAIDLGDDNLGTVRESKRDVMNQPLLRKYYAYYGFDYTTTDKTTHFVNQLEQFKDANFLKRTFRYDSESGHWMAPLVPKSIFKMLTFVKTPKIGTVLDVQVDTVNNAVAECFFHGRTWYNEIVPRIYDIVRPHLNMVARYREYTYDYFLQRYMAGEVVWRFDAPVQKAEFSDFNVQAETIEPGNLSSGVLNDFSGVEAVTNISLPSAPIVPRSQFRDNAQLQHFFQRDVRLTSFAISSGNAAYSTIYSYDVVGAWLGNSAVADKLSNYWFFRGSFKIKVLVECAPTTQGIYFIAPVYSNTSGSTLDDSLSNYGNVASYFQGPHAIINPAMNNNVEFTLPFVCSNEAMSTVISGDTNRMYVLLKLICISPLRQSTDAAATVSGTIAVYASAGDDFELGGVSPQGGQYPSRSLSSALSRGSTILEKMAAVPIISSVATPLSQGLAVASDIASAFGYTRHRAPEAPGLMKGALVSGLGPTDGQDRSLAVAHTHGCITSIDPALVGGSGGEDDSSFAYLWQRDTLITTVSWQASQGTNYVLANLPVTPGLCFEQAGTYWQPTTTGYFAAPFQFWRGALRYRTHIGCSAMQAGALAWIWSPSGFTVGSTLATDPTNISNSCVMDISADITKVIEVGWNSARSMCDLQLGSLATSWPTTSVNGYISLIVVSPLRGIADVSTTVMITQAANPSLVVGGYRQFVSRSASTVPIESVLQTQASLQDPQGAPENCLLCGTADELPNLDAIHLGEVVKSVRVLAQKFSPVGKGNMYMSYATSAVKGEWTCRFMIPFYPYPYAHSTGNPSFGNLVSDYPAALEFSSTKVLTAFPCTETNYRFNHLGWIRAAFLGVRGGVLLKVIPTDDTLGGTGVGTSNAWRKVSAYGVEGQYRLSTVIEEDTFSYPLSVTGATEWLQTGGRGATFSNGTTTGEFYIPYASAARFKAGFIPYDHNDIEGKWIQIAATIAGQDNATNRIYAALYQAGAADIAFVRFRFVPAVSIPSGGGAAAMMAPIEEEEFSVQNPGEVPNAPDDAI